MPFLDNQVVGLWLYVVSCFSGAPVIRGQSSSKIVCGFPVLQVLGTHLCPFRTEPLSPVTPMVLGH